MSEAMLIALVQFATRFGIDAAMAFFESRGATIDDALAALKKAKDKSLDQYIAEAKPPGT